MHSEIPAVSVIMPVYNAANFLTQSVESILKQTFTDFELIVINDGSTDNSEEIIKGYNDQRIRYYKQANAGVANTLNRGVFLAKGKYIWRHDADDISLPEKLQEEFTFLKANPDVALCACQVAFMTERGKVAWKYRQPDNTYFGNLIYREVKREDFNPYSPITHGTVLIRTDVIREFGAYREEFITGEDLDLWLQLIQKYKAVVLNRCLSFHRLNKGSATQKHSPKNDFYRNLAVTYYDQRIKEGQDDLQKGILPVFPGEQTDTVIDTARKGKLFRSDILLFLYPLHINARDFKGSMVILKFALSDGWKLKETWKAVVLPFLGKRIIAVGVKIKGYFRAIG
jgi:glycosyltransferase involved in cell wall biosynthesis